MLNDFGKELAGIEEWTVLSGSMTSPSRISLLCSPIAEASSSASTSAAHRIPLPPTEAAAALLRSVCEPARFGLGPETVLDPTVRSALMLPPSCFALDAASSAAALPSPELLARIAAVLTPNLGRGASLRCVPINLNVYAEGDFFREHQDTPHKGLVASLVVRLPSEYTGGALVLRRGGEVVARLFDGCSLSSSACGGGGGSSAGAGAAADSEQQAQRTVEWAAFPPDVRHEIEPVRSGTRITLAFGLYASSVDAAAAPAAAAAAAADNAAAAATPPSPAATLPPPRELPPRPLADAAATPAQGAALLPPHLLRAERACAALQRLLAAGRHRPGALVGLPLRHSYGRDISLPVVYDGSPSLRPELLVGADAELYLLAAETLGLNEAAALLRLLRRARSGVL